MKLSGLHILLTYTCNYECDHCFVWGSPRQTGVFTWARLEDVFRQTAELGTVEEVYFEGGEAFLYYPLLAKAIGRAHESGFRTGIVSNAYWATSPEDARLWIGPLADAGLDELDVSSDVFHGDEVQERQAQNAVIAARACGIETAKFHLNPPIAARVADLEQLGTPVTGGDIMYRGRAAEVVETGAIGRPWSQLDTCPYEDLLNPSRLHLNPFGNLHLCQGLVAGNLFTRSLKDIVAGYDAATFPIASDLLAGGPAQLVRKYQIAHAETYADACQLCYSVRKTLRFRFPEILTPDQMYGVA